MSRCYHTAAFVDDQCERVEDHFRTLFQSLEMGSSSAELRADTLRSGNRQWKQLRSSRSCLWCLRRKPEHVLMCDHAVCDMCVSIFGKAVPKTEYQFSLTACILCSCQSSLVAKLKPPTGGVRLLCVDGGGTRGVIPLEFLTLLQENVGSDYPLQDLFDLAFGTSSGKVGAHS